MSYRVRDVMALVASGEPVPPRTVDDFVAAGRRRRAVRRRNLAIGGAALLVLAAAVLVVTPVLAHGSPRHPSSRKVVYPTEPFAFGFAAYDSGPLHVATPIFVQPAYQMANVLRDAEQVAVLIVYRPGAFEASTASGNRPADVHGRPAYFVPKSSNGLSSSALVWQYADNAWAELRRNGGAVVSDPELTSVASDFTAGGADLPARVPYIATYIPVGFHVVAVGTQPPLPDAAVSYVTLSTQPPRMTGFRDTSDLSTGTGINTLSVSVVPNSDHISVPAEHSTPRCGDDYQCAFMTADGRFWVTTTSQAHAGAPSQAELKKVLSGLRFVTGDARDAWPDVVHAFS